MQGLALQDWVHLRIIQKQASHFYQQPLDLTTKKSKKWNNLWYIQVQDSMDLPLGIKEATTLGLREVTTCFSHNNDKGMSYNLFQHI
jgi:hypothetical protein